MTTLQQLAKVAAMDAAGQLDSASSAALNELRKRAAQFGQNLAQFIEPALTVGSGVAGSIAGGLVGLAGLPYGVEAAANAVKRTQDWMTYVPRTEAGQKGLAQVGSAMGNIENRVNTATGIASGALTYGATGDVTQAANVGAQVYQEGLGEAAGGYVTDKTGSPLLGTATKLIPDIADAVIGMKGIKPALKGMKQFEMGGISGQKFGQAGSVSGVNQSTGGGAYNVTKRDESGIFGEGAEAVRYTDPETGGTMEVLTRPNQARDASVLELFVPEEHRRKGVAKGLLNEVMAKHPSLMGQVSSRHAAKNAYAMGRRPMGEPNATLEETYKIMDEWTSVNMVTPE